MGTVKKSKIKLFSNNENTETQNDSIDNIESQESAEHKIRSDEEFDEQKLGEKEIDIDEKNIRPKKVAVNFMEEEYIDDYTSQSTPDPIGEDNTVDAIRQQLKDEESQEGEKMSYKDYEDIADFLITLFDGAMATGLRIYAKDKSDSAYSLRADKKKMLVRGLTKILIKYNSRFSVEFMFFVGLIVAYIAPVQAARESRKDVKKYTPNKYKNKDEEKDESDYSNVESITPEVIMSQTKKVFKRKPGRPHKKGF